MLVSLLSLPTCLGPALHSTDDFIMIGKPEVFVDDGRVRSKHVGCWGAGYMKNVIFTLIFLLLPGVVQLWPKPRKTEALWLTSGALLHKVVDCLSYYSTSSFQVISPTGSCSWKPMRYFS